MHEGSGRTTVVARRPQNASASAPNRRSPVNSAEYSTIKSPTDSADIISQKLSMLDSLLDDLNSARRSYDHRGHEHSASCSHAASTTTNASTLPNNRHSAHSPTNNGYASLNRRNRTPSPGMYPTLCNYPTLLLLYCFLRICKCVCVLLHWLSECESLCGGVGVAHRSLQQLACAWSLTP